MYSKTVACFLIGLVAVISTVYAIPVGSTLSTAALEGRSDTKRVEIQWGGDTKLPQKIDGMTRQQTAHLTKEMAGKWLLSIFKRREAKKKLEQELDVSAEDIEPVFIGQDEPWKDNQALFKVVDPDTREILSGHMKIIGFSSTAPGPLNSHSPLGGTSAGSSGDGIVTVRTWIGRNTRANTLDTVFESSNRFTLLDGKSR